MDNSLCCFYLPLRSNSKEPWLRCSKLRSIVISIALLLLSIVIPNCPALGQTGSQTGSLPDESAKPPGNGAGGEAALTRLRAVGLLEELLGEVRSVDEKEIRVVMKAKIADALWDHDQDKARRYFGEAVAEMIALLKTQESTVSEAGDTGMTRFQALVKLLGMVARRDSRLAKQLAEAAIPGGKSGEGRSVSPADAVERSKQYARFALGTLDSDVNLSVELAGESIAKEIDSSFIAYLTKLRAKHQSAAAELFSQTLSSVLNSSTSWARGIDLLALYAIPGFGSALVRENLGLSGIPEVNMDSGRLLLGAVCEMAGRQLRDPETPAPSDNAWLRNTAFNGHVLFKLLPYYGRMMPQCADIIRMRADGLMKFIPSAKAQEQMAKSGRTLNAEELISEASGAKSKDEQDQYYLLALQQAVEKGEWDQARRFAEMFNNEATRAAWRSQVGYRAALALLDKRDIDAATIYARLITNADNIAHVYSRMAVLLYEDRQSDHAIDVLRQARTTVVKSDDESHRADALLLLAGAAVKVDELLGFEIASAAIDALNRFGQGVRAKKQIHRAGNDRKPNSSRLEESLFQLARVYFDETIRLARLIEDPQSSIQSRIEICRSVLMLPVQKEPKRSSKMGAGNPEKSFVLHSLRSKLWSSESASHF